MVPTVRSLCFYSRAPIKVPAGDLRIAAVSARSFEPNSITRSLRRRQELRNEVAVADMHLHGVEARVVGRRDGTPEILGDLGDLAAAHAPHGRIGVEVEARRRTDGNLPGGGQMGHVAAVADLNAAGSPSASRDTIR